MPSNNLTLHLQAAVLDYFTGERHAMLLILGGAFLMAALAIWLLAATRSSFTTGFSAMVLAVSILLSGIAGGLLVRDRALSSGIVEGIQSADQASTIHAERQRISTVIGKYAVYRRVVAAVAMLGLLALLLSDRSWLHGVSAGLLTLVIAQVLIDHYSQGRAEAYLLAISSQKASFAIHR
ncbi:hypothetical protein [Lysobacter solisilvae (ex Woo and Kim 2020)]|uniref:Uncharacterized protein n=1 Tax=Agrilutibacter terrestris TaxID=2865112 RepID=A0A7H0G144_9GAMM|nr:hypothetical protein [Lysobacter terrestris]QNP42010.1 hypothetical protein H8B22_07410 [Lysobacter terrestris]